MRQSNCQLGMYGTCSNLIKINHITDDMAESDCSMIGKIPPKGVSFSDIICNFALSLMIFSCIDFFAALRSVKNRHGTYEDV